MASSVAALSVPWQLAWTMTLRAKPSRSRSANSMSGPASCGQIFGLGAEREAAGGPKTWQCASTAPGGGTKRGLRRIERPAADAALASAVMRTPPRPSACARCAAARRSTDVARLVDRRARSSSRRSDARPTASCARPPGTTATAAAGEPSIRQAVATLTAPSTPIEAWARCGMKLRTVIAPPCARRRDQHHLGHRFFGDVAQVHQRPGLEADRLDPAP